MDKTHLSKLDKIRMILGIHKFEKITLLDGTIAEVEALTEGATLKLDDGAGNLTPAKAGSYETETETITVDDQGVIMSVVAKTPEAIAEPVPVAAAEEVVPEEVPAEEGDEEKPMIEELVKKVVEENMAQIFATLDTMATELASCKTKLTEMGATFAAFKKAPAAEPIKKSTFEKSTFTDLEEKVQNLRNLRQEFNKK